MNRSIPILTLIVSILGSGCSAKQDGSYLLPDGILRNVARTVERGTCTNLMTGSECNLVIDGLTSSYDNTLGVYAWNPSDTLELNFNGHNTDLLEMVVYQASPYSIKDISVTINGVSSQFELAEQSEQRIELDHQDGTNVRVQLLSMHGGSSTARLLEIQFLSKEDMPRYPAGNIFNVAGALYGGKVYSSSYMDNPVELLNDDITRSSSPYYWRPSPIPVKLATVRFDFHVRSQIRQVRLFYGMADVPAIISFDSRNLTEVFLPSLSDHLYTSYDINIDINTVSDYMVLVFENKPLFLSEVMVYGYHLEGQDALPNVEKAKGGRTLAPVPLNSLDVDHKDADNKKTRKPHRSLLRKSNSKRQN